MIAVDKPLSQSKVVSGAVVLLCVMGLLLVTLYALVAAERQLDSMTARAMELGQQVEEQATIIEAQEELISLYLEQNETLSSILGQTVDVLDSLAYGPFSREEIQEIIAEVVIIISEVNKAITPAEVEEVSQAIVFNALAADIDPYLLLSIAVTESHCRPDIRGESGEYGMMQVMPGTGAWIAGELGYADYDPAQLLEIRANVQYAAYYLRISIREFGGDVSKGLLAYNRGGAGARRWLQKQYAENHLYVRKVMNTYDAIREG